MSLIDVDIPTGDDVMDHVLAPPPMFTVDMLALSPSANQLSYDAMRIDTLIIYFYYQY